MIDRIVVAYAGNRPALESLVRAGANEKAEVIAVVLDLGGTAPLAGWRDEALAAGASRCHAMDVREAFAKEVVVPALKSGRVPDPRAAVAALAAAFVERTLRTVARLEAHARVDLAPVGVPWTEPPRWSFADSGAVAEVTFAAGAPIAVNGIPMTVTEVLESLQTITGQAAIDALHLAYHELSGVNDGSVALIVRDGSLAATSTAAVS